MEQMMFMIGVENVGVSLVTKPELANKLDTVFAVRLSRSVNA